MAGLTTDAAKARRYLERALAVTRKPTLANADIDDLFEDAKVEDNDGNTVYTSASLNAAASKGWQWKASLTADAYEDMGNNGKYLKRSDWSAKCLRMAQQYASGALDVLEGTIARSSIGSIGVTSSTAAASRRCRIDEVSL